MTIHRYITIFDISMQPKCIDTVSLPNVSRYDDILIYCCISIWWWAVWQFFVCPPNLNNANIVLYLLICIVATAFHHNANNDYRPIHKIFDSPISLLIRYIVIPFNGNKCSFTMINEYMPAHEASLSGGSWQYLMPRLPVCTYVPDKVEPKTLLDYSNLTMMHSP